LVTGADGFVGRWLVQALTERGAQTWAFVWANSAPGNLFQARDNPPVVVSGDVTDLEKLSDLITSQGIDTVYHLAANNINTGAGISPYAVFETNLRGTYTVLEACRRAPRPPWAIVASSREVEDCFRPQVQRGLHPYMTSKAAAELVTGAYRDTYKVPGVLVRSDNLYGGGDLNWSRLVPSTIRAVLRGEPPVLRSSGDLQRDFVYIEDAIAAYLAVGERCSTGPLPDTIFRIATGTGVSVLDMVKEIANAAGRSDLQPRVLNENRNERVDKAYQPELEHRVLGWQPKFSLPSGLARTVAWYRKHGFEGPPGKTTERGAAL
jgi:CDP-glucose 4,6-dehydratase